MAGPEEDREFFVATAGAGGALRWLLFVAVSVYPERARQSQAHNTSKIARLEKIARQHPQGRIVARQLDVTNAT